LVSFSTHNLLIFQRVVDESGNVVSQLCDENNNLGPIQFEQAMRKQAGIEWVVVWGGKRGRG
jgi:hypothetical protein